MEKLTIGTGLTGTFFRCVPIYTTGSSSNIAIMIHNIRSSISLKCWKRWQIWLTYLCYSNCLLDSDNSMILTLLVSPHYHFPLSLSHFYIKTFTTMSSRFGSALVAGGILGTLVVSTCCICCCCHYKRSKRERRRRDEECAERRRQRSDSGRDHDEGRRVSANTNTY